MANPNTVTQDYAGAGGYDGSDRYLGILPGNIDPCTEPKVERSPSQQVLLKAGQLATEHADAA